MTPRVSQRDGWIVPIKRYNLSKSGKVLKANYVRGSNFGDCVFPYMMNKLGVPHQWTCHTEKYKVISTGSILGVGTKEHTIVWGSGIINRNTTVDPGGIFELVRGKYSAEAIKKDTPLGDPALALRRFYDPEDIDPIHEIGIIPHQIHFNEIVKEMKEKGIKYKVIEPSTNVGKGFEKYIREVTSCKRIISTSLHGVIAAHAYNIPAIPYHYDDALVGDGVKFQDYYSVWKGYNNIDFLDLMETMPLEFLEDSKKFWSPTRQEVNTISDAIMNSCPLTSELASSYFVD